MVKETEVNKILAMLMTETGKDGRMILSDAMDSVNELAEKSKAHWVVASSTIMHCSNCGEVEALDINRKYCAWCGAEMQKERVEKLL